MVLRIIVNFADFVAASILDFTREYVARRRSVSAQGLCSRQKGFGGAGTRAQRIESRIKPWCVPSKIAIGGGLHAHWKSVLKSGKKKLAL